MDCLFCKIGAGEIPSYTVYEDEIVRIFLDIHPDSNGHLLIIPKNHTLDMESIDEKTLNHIFKMAKEYIRNLKRILGADGVTLIQNNGMIQEVKHFHLHLKPYYQKPQKIMPIEEVYNKLKQGL